MQNIYNYQLYISTFMFGYLAAQIPSDKSNISPLLSAWLLGAFLSKLFYGDFDKGHRWSKSDMLYTVVVSILSLFGGATSIIVNRISGQD